jgi:hypothetical protein
MDSHEDEAAARAEWDEMRERKHTGAPSFPFCATSANGLPTAANDETHPDLFATPAPSATHVHPATRSTDPETSRRAETRARRHFTVKQLAVLHTFQAARASAAPVLTYDELVERFEKQRQRRRDCAWYPALTDSSIRTRCKELRDLGYVQHVDDTGITKSGGMCARWAITPSGQALDVDAKRASASKKGPAKKASTG